ncbi:MAG: hypothetical protein HXL00_00135 [Candidatus Nanosynbacter sp.]|nr:hypothetical protein [Candidatus Nanosynbacter sp.]
MARYTAQHAYRPSKGHGHKRPAYEYDQPKSQHDKPSVVRRLTALTAAVAALIGGGYISYQHYQPSEKTSVAAARPTSGELAKYTESPFVTDPATDKTHCRDKTRQEITVTAENPQTTITNPDGSTTRLTMVKFSTGEQERTQATLVYSSNAKRGEHQVPIAIATGPSETGKGGWNVTTSPDIGYAGTDIQASMTASGPGETAIACAPLTTSSQSK